MKTEIKKGDIVDIIWEQSPCEFRVKVLYVPYPSGGCWQFQREDGTIVYVDIFAKIVLHKEDQ